MYELQSGAPDNFWWADYWAGALGTRPGSATGAQTLESFHSFWQGQIQDQARASPTNILHTMQRCTMVSGKHGCKKTEAGMFPCSFKTMIVNDPSFNYTLGCCVPGWSQARRACFGQTPQKMRI